MNVATLLAPNPGLYTGPGTNTYVLTSGAEAVVIDPGPVIDEHADAIAEALVDHDPQAVLVTHSHIDHAPLAVPLARQLGVAALGHAPGDGFVPDDLLDDGDVVTIGGERLVVVSTPGHSDDHLCFLAGSLLFTGDHIMGGSTVMVQHMGDYLRSLEKVAALAVSRILPGHGPLIENPSEVIDHYIDHRLDRERQIVAALREGDRSVGDVVSRVYAEVDPDLHPLAAMSVTAHLRKLQEEGVVHLTEAGELWDALVEMVT